MNAHDNFAGTGIRQAFTEPPEADDLMTEALAEEMEREFPTKRKEQHMANAKYDPSKYQNATVATPRVSPFDELVNAVEELRGCDHQFSILADRLAGPQPQEVAGNNPNGGGGGLIDVVERAIVAIRAITSNLSEHHSRIDRRL